MNPTEFFKQSAKGAWENLKTLLCLIWNKGVAFLIFFYAIHYWIEQVAIAKAKQDQGIEYAIPFSEMIFGAIVISGIIALAPLVRFIIFPESSEYSERGWLKRDISEGQTFVTAAMKHYWFATTISYAVTALSLWGMMRAQ